MFELIVFGTLLVVLIGALGTAVSAEHLQPLEPALTQARPVGAEAPHVAVRVACGELA